MCRDGCTLCIAADKDHKFCGKKIHCWLTKNLKNNHDMWVAVLKHEEAQKGRETTIEDLRKSVTRVVPIMQIS